MNIESFHYFCQVARSKSITKVAQSQHISQSALSQQIQRFEDSLGFPLLERSNKGVSLTPMGEVAMKYCENIVKTYEKMLKEINAAQENNSVVRIIASYAITDYSLPCTLYKIKERYGYHKYELTSFDSATITENVQNNISDVGFIYGDLNLPDLHCEKLGTSAIVMVTNFNSAVPDEIQIHELSKYPLIALNDRYEIKTLLKKNLQPHGYSYEELSILFETDSIEALKSSVSRGHGLGILPYVAVKEEIYRKKFKAIKISGTDMIQTVSMISKRGEPSNRAVAEFLDAFKELGSGSFC